MFTLKRFFIRIEKMNAKETWKKPEIRDLGEAKDIIKNVFKAGVNDFQPGMVNILASTL